MGISGVNFARRISIDSSSFIFELPLSHATHEFILLPAVSLISRVERRLLIATTIYANEIVIGSFLQEDIGRRISKANDAGGIPGVHIAAISLP